jgi:hypothetical protein
VPRAHIKKDEIQRVITKDNIDICLIQEPAIPVNFPINNLTISRYSIEVENNEFKLRTCMYIKMHQLQKKKPS